MNLEETIKVLIRVPLRGRPRIGLPLTRAMPQLRQPGDDLQEAFRFCLPASLHACFGMLKRHEGRNKCDNIRAA